jgi:hypothetical protein
MGCEPEHRPLMPESVLPLQGVLRRVIDAASGPSTKDPAHPDQTHIIQYHSRANVVLTSTA